MDIVAVDPQLRALARPLRAAAAGGSGAEASPDGRGRVLIPARDVLPLGAAMAASCAARWPRPRGAGGRRSARGELRHLARRGRAADLGGQRFRRGVTLPYTQDLVRVAPARCWRSRSRGSRSRRGAPASRCSRATRNRCARAAAAVVLAERYRWLRDLADRALEGSAALLGAHARAARLRPRVSVARAPAAGGGVAAARERGAHRAAPGRPRQPRAGGAWWRSVAGTAP